MHLRWMNFLQYKQYLNETLKSGSRAISISATSEFLKILGRREAETPGVGPSNLCFAFWQILVRDQV